MSVHSYDQLREHIGHDVEVVGYQAESGKPVNVAIECNTCFMVLVEYDEGENAFTDWKIGEAE